MLEEELFEYLLVNEQDKRDNEDIEDDENLEIEIMQKL